MARITSKGQITVPKEVRERLGVQPGDALEFVVDDQAQTAEMRPVKRRRLAEFRGIFKAARAPDEPFDWDTQRRRAWEAQTERLVPAAKEAGGLRRGRGALGSRPARG